MRKLGDQIFTAAKLALTPYLGVLALYVVCYLLDCSTRATGIACITAGLLVSAYLLYVIVGRMLK